MLHVLYIKAAVHQEANDTELAKRKKSCLQHAPIKFTLTVFTAEHNTQRYLITPNIYQRLNLYIYSILLHGISQA